jgi:uncharacterized protein (DUF3084 family)
MTPPNAARPLSLVGVMPRQTADLVALILAGVVAIVVVLTTLALLYVQIINPRQDIAAAGDFVSRIISVLVAALVGYMAGRRINGG